MAATSLALADCGVGDTHARWFELLEAGIPTTEIARRYRVCVRTVQRGLARHRADSSEVRHALLTDLLDPPCVTPLYGPKAFTPQTSCGDIHPHGPIPRGHRVYCEVCGRTGCEDHPLLQPMPGDEKPCRTVQAQEGSLRGGIG